MYTFWAFIRQSLVRITLCIGRILYKVSSGAFPKSMFYMTVSPKTLDTDVRVVCKDNDSTTIAKFGPDGKIKNEEFKILSTTDIHLGDDPKLRKKAFEMLANHVYDTKPDLVIFTGDIILSRFQQIDAIQFAQFMEKLGIYWAIVFGNHEVREEKGFYKYLMMKSFSDYEHCLATFGPDELYGYGNYAINILNGENSLQQSLFFFDSGRDVRDHYLKDYNLPSDLKGYDFLKREQINWYKNKVAALKEKYGDFKSLMYMHIPLKEYEDVIKADSKGGFKFTDKCKVLYGSAHESVGSSAYNSGMFDAILEMKSTQAIFSGHDHVNDFCADCKGVLLVYNQAGGYETYTIGSNFNWDEKDWPQGVTITDVHTDGSIDVSQRFSRIYL